MMGVKYEMEMYALSTLLEREYRDTQQIEIGDGYMHIDFARGAYAGRWTPRIFFYGRGFGQGDQLLRDMQPLAVIALPDALRRRLSRRGGRA